MIDDLLTLAADAVSRARRLGADAADALAVDARSTDIDVRDGMVEKLEHAESREVGLRVFVGRGSAMISTSLLSAASLERLAETAVATARLAPPDPFAGLASGEQLATRFADLDLVSEHLPAADELKVMTYEAEEAALAVPGVAKSGGAGAASSSRSQALVTSNGFAHGYRRTAASVSASAVAGDGTAMERDYDYTTAIHASDLRAARDVGRIAGERAARRLHPRKVKSQSVPVIFDRRISSGLVGHFAAAINGSAIARGASFLKDSLDRQVFAAGIEIVDDPLRPRGLGSRPFDGEGLPVEPRKLIDGGTLTGFLLDLRSARQLGMAPLGNGARGLASPPQPSSSNLHMAAGGISRDDMIRGVHDGFYVTELIGMGVNLVNGDYSRGASGFWIVDGELAYPVSEVTIAGNLAAMFGNLTAASDLEFRFAVNAPTCRVDGMTIAGT